MPSGVSGPARFQKYLFDPKNEAGQGLEKELDAGRAGDRRRADAADALSPSKAAGAHQETREEKRLNRLASTLPDTLHVDKHDYTVTYKDKGKGVFAVKLDKKGIDTKTGKTDKGAPVLPKEVLEIGTLFVGDARFEPAGTVGERQIFVRLGEGESPKQYIEDRHGRKIPRYQVRYINPADATNYMDDKPMVPKHSQSADPTKGAKATASKKEAANFGYEGKLSEEKQAIAHATWGDQRFVSLTSTGRPIVGSTGRSFSGKTGVVVVDLALIPRQQTLSLHDAETLAGLTGAREPQDLVTGAGGARLEETEDTEANARIQMKADAIRTKEVLVRQIPPNAVVATHFVNKDLAGKSMAPAPDGDPHLVKLFTKAVSNMS